MRSALLILLAGLALTAATTPAVAQERFELDDTDTWNAVDEVDPASPEGQLRAIRRTLAEGRADREDNALKNAPHTAREVTADVWAHPYSREQAAFPAPWCREHKFWPAVARVDNGWGDRNLMCTCPPVEAFSAPERAPADPEAVAAGR